MLMKKLKHNVSVEEFFELNKFYLKFCGVFPPEYKQMPIYSSIKYFFCVFVNITLFALQLIGTCTLSDAKTMPQ